MMVILGYGGEHLKVLFYCKMGEKRSAAVLAIALMTLLGMTTEAADEHIRKRRERAGLDR